jgi:hypothetical protein
LAKPVAPDDRLLAWADLVTHRSAAARIGKVLEAEISAQQRRDLLRRQRSRFGVAATPAVDLLQEMIAEDYRLDRTVVARRVVFSEAEAALFLTCCAAHGDGARRDDA